MKKRTKPFRIRRLKDKTEGLLNFSDYKKPWNRFLYGVVLFLLLVFAMTALIPMLWLFLTSFKSVSEINSNVYHLFPSSFDLDKIVSVWQKTNFGRYYLNTLIVVVGSMISAVVFNGVLAYVIAILKPVGSKVLNALILVSYMVPAMLAVFPLLMEIKSLGLINTYWPLWLSFGANAYYYLLFKDYFEKLPPSLIEAARVDGGNDIDVFLNVILPLSRPIIGIVAIFAMTASYSDFLVPYLVLNDQSMQTVMVAIYRLSATDTLDASEFLLLLVISVIPQVLIFIVFQKQIMGTAANSGMKE
jgi:multiple sugar transport system permease protein